MARLEVHEGTWEELAAHAEEFKGRKLRLIVLPQDAETSALVADDTALHDLAEQLFSEADNIERTPDQSSNDPHEAAFDEIVIEKYRITATDALNF